MKTIMNRCKFTFAVMACALPLAVQAGNPPMASDNMMSDGMNTKNSAPMDGMKSDKMMNDAKSSSGAMMSDMKMAGPPQVGEMAPDFTLKTLDGQSVRLANLTAKSDVVLVVLRGWPGYQCPICTRQAHDYVHNAKKFKAAGAQVLMVYPGPADDLKMHANDFLSDKNWPKDFLLVLDPDYSFTKAYGLRWDAPNETAYPSTFIIGKDGKVLFMHVSKQHGDRVGADAALKALPSAMPMM